MSRRVLRHEGLVILERLRGDIDIGSANRAPHADRKRLVHTRPVVELYAAQSVKYTYADIDRRVHNVVNQCPI